MRGTACVDFYSALTGGDPLTSDELSWGCTNEIAPDRLAEVSAPARPVRLVVLRPVEQSDGVFAVIAAQSAELIQQLRALRAGGCVVSPP